jgi:site-specific DNA-cytosine methylase
MDIGLITPTDIRRYIKDGTIELLWSSPPCTEFSTAKRGEKNTDIANLVLSVIKWIETVKIKTLIVENVPAMRDYEVYRQLKSYLTKAYPHYQEYNVEHSFVGGATMRKRLFIFASDYPLPLRISKIEVEGKPYVVKGDAIGSNCQESDKDNKSFANKSETPSVKPIGARAHIRVLDKDDDRWSPITDKRDRRFLKAIENYDRLGLFEGEEFLAHQGIHPSARHLDSLANAITANIRGQLYVIGGDKKRYRLLTIEEIAALQGFSPDYAFIGSKTAKIKQIGSSVPPSMAEAVVSSVFACR